MSQHSLSIFSLLLLSILFSVDAFLCDHLADNSWESLINAIELSFDGFLMLCPFEISGENCPPVDESGYTLSFETQSNLYLMCESVVSFGPPSGIPGGEDISFAATGTGCIIDCPGIHFKVGKYTSLSLDSITLRGSTSSAIQVNNQGMVNAFNSYFQK